MGAKIIDGNAVAQLLRADYKRRIERLQEKTGITPGLALVLVGDNPAPAVYVNNKMRERLKPSLAASPR
jgi:methylenetetrahydrofolate dehydrogenase (NADP+) / methenyltetrahydrofolate cyclohydrolase